MSVPCYNVWTNDPFIYKATVSGIKVYDFETGSLLNFIEHIYTSSVWANDEYMYLATSVSGIYRCEVPTVTGTTTLAPYKQYPEITSNCVYCIHGNGDYLCATTISGVNHYDLTTGSSIYTTLSDTGKCFQTARGEFYYSYNPPGADKELHVVYDNISNWDTETVGYIYTMETCTVSSTINDLHITEGTSRYNEGNVLFIATSDGVTVIEEKLGDEEDSNFKYYTIRS